MCTESLTSRRVHSLSIRVPFPAGHPHTEFRRHADAMAYLLLSYESEDDTVFLHSFYVHAHDSDLATLAEKRASKGLGHRMLCHALARLIARGAITPDATISLEASGGRCDEAMVQRLMETHTEAEVDAFLEAFPTNVADLLDEFPNADAPYHDKALLKCVYDANQKLVAHYQTYGLHVVPVARHERDVVYEPMRGVVRDVLHACDGAPRRSPTHGGGRRRSPRRDRR